MEIDICFNFDEYPTLKKFRDSNAYIRFILGPVGCLPYDTEVMTRDGWQPISTNIDEALVYNKDTDIAYFDKVEQVKYPCNEFHRFYNKKLDMVLSDEHKIYYKININKNKWKVITAKELALSFEDNKIINGNIPIFFKYNDNSFNTIGHDLIIKYLDNTANQKRAVSIKTLKYQKVKSKDGYKYCLHTKTGLFVARHNGKVFITGNSAKTTACVFELLRLAMNQEVAQDGVRYTNAIVVRATLNEMKRSTIKSFQERLGPIFKVKTQNPYVAQCIFNLNDGTKVNLDIDFISLDSDQDTSKLLGSENTFIFLDEVSTLKEEVVMAVMERNGRYPSGLKGKPTRYCIIGTTNGPAVGSWFHKWYLGENKKVEDMITARMKEYGDMPDDFKFLEFFKQPPALLRPKEDGGEWLPNPDAENIHNLNGGYTYYYKLLTLSEDRIQSRIEGDFSLSIKGTPVFTQFNRKIHIAPKEKVQPKTPINYFLSFDFGNTPVCLLGYINTFGSLIILEEFMIEKAGVNELYEHKISPVILNKYYNSKCQECFIDPAGFTIGQNIALSPADILRSKGLRIYTGYKSNRTGERIEAVRDFLTRLVAFGNAKLIISDNCPFLIDSISSRYIYEERRSGTEIKIEPTGTHINWISDLADALQYMCIGIKAREHNNSIVDNYDDIEYNREYNWFG